VLDCVGLALTSSPFLQLQKRSLVAQQVAVSAARGRETLIILTDRQRTLSIGAIWCCHRWSGATLSLPAHGKGVGWR